MFSVISFLFLAAGAAVLLEWVIGLIQRRFGKLPPGPLPWPLFGNLLAFAKSSTRFETTTKYGRKYGGIFSSKIGMQKHMVVITSYKYFREALVDHTWEFSSRPKNIWMKDETTDRYPGIIASDSDETARNMRKFALVTLRNFGFGKSSMQDSILHESENLNEGLRKLAGQPFNSRALMAHTTSNVIAMLTFGRTYIHGDPTMKRINAEVTMAMQQLVFIGLVGMFPFLRFLELIPGNPKQTMMNYYGSVKKFLRNIIGDHQESRISGNPHDFIDAWLDQQEKSGKSEFPTEKLENVVMDIFAGGFETSSTAFQWLFAMLLHHPDEQDKIHQEIDSNVGSATQITLEHRDSLPYTEAFILETLRLFPVLPFTINHETIEDATIGPYRIPKGTTVGFSLHDILTAPDLWTDPESFQPERFIQEGHLKVPEYYVAFGAGRRSCIGEQLARKEIFLLFANILRRFRVTCPPGDSLPSLAKLPVAVLSPIPFEVIMTERVIH